jgi:hypothetical protein
MVNNSTSNNKTNNYLKQLLTDNKNTTYGVESPGLGLVQSHKCGGFKPVNRIPTLPLVSIYISDKNEAEMCHHTTVNKYMTRMRQKCATTQQ